MSNTTSFFDPPLEHYMINQSTIDNTTFKIINPQSRDNLCTHNKNNPLLDNKDKE